MALEARNLSLFGFDLSRLVPAWRTGWSEAMNWPLFAWMTPSVPVRVVMPDGSRECRRGASAKVLEGRAQTDCLAVVVPEDLVLIRRLEMPALSKDALRDALQLEVQSASPFDVDATAWGWRSDLRPDGGQTTWLAMAPRGGVKAVLDSHEGAAEAEAWVNGSAPIVLQGFGESFRLRREVRQRALLLSAMLLVLVSVTLLAVTPFLILRQQVFDAQAQYAVAQRTASEALAARSELQLAREQLLEIREGLFARTDIAALLETLSKEIPDSTHLVRLSVRGASVQVFGQGTNLSELVDRLGSNPEFVSMRSPTPISRLGGTNQEQFSIEFSYRPLEPASAPEAKEG